jgi:hypothetical protein
MLLSLRRLQRPKSQLIKCRPFIKVVNLLSSLSICNQEHRLTKLLFGRSLHLAFSFVHFSISTPFFILKVAFTIEHCDHNVDD